MRGKFEVPGIGALIDWEDYLHDVLWDPGDPTGTSFAVRLATHTSDALFKDRNEDIALATVLADPPKEFKRIDDYERRAISRPGKVLRRLDYERIDAERMRKTIDPFSSNS